MYSSDRYNSTKVQNSLHNKHNPTIEGVPKKRLVTVYVSTLAFYFPTYTYKSDAAWICRWITRRQNKRCFVLAQCVNVTCHRATHGETNNRSPPRKVSSQMGRQIHPKCFFILFRWWQTARRKLLHFRLYAHKNSTVFWWRYVFIFRHVKVFKWRVCMRCIAPLCWIYLPLCAGQLLCIWITTRLWWKIEQKQ
jgi:hypothetical protein